MKTLKVLKRNRKLTLFFISDANRPIVRARIPKRLLYIVPAVLITAVLCAGCWVYQTKINDMNRARSLSSQLDFEQKQVQTITQTKDQTIENLQGSLIRLAEQSEQVKSKLEVLQRQQAELQKLADPNVEQEEAEYVRPRAAAPYGVGGVHQPPDESNTAQAVAQIASSYRKLDEQINQLTLQLGQLQEQIEQQRQREQATPSIWPIDSTVITSGFGLRHDPFTEHPDFHNGIDIGAKAREPVYATADGVIQFAGSDALRGNYIEIDHSYGLVSIYMHLSKILVRRGEQVHKGEQIGLAGSTGRSTGPHLHYEIHKDGKVIDPMDYLPSK